MSTVADSATSLDPESITQCGPDFAGHPAEFCASQERAWERFNELPMPRRNDENWRFTDVRALTLAPFVRATEPTPALCQELSGRSKGIPAAAGVMAFANDRLISTETKSDALRGAGVIWQPFEQAAREHPELLARYFMREKSALGSEKFAALHASQVKAGMVLYVPKGIEIKAPIEVFHWLEGKNSAVFPHTLIIAEDNARVTVVDHFYSAGSAPGLVVGVNDIVAGPGAKVNYVAIQNWNTATTAFHLNATTVARDAEVIALRLNLGGAFIRDEATSRLRGPGGRSEMLSVSAAWGSQIFDQRTLQIHEAPNAKSDLLYKNALNDTARTVFTGLIRVDEGAHKTDAYQKVRNLMLSDEAEANSAPGLEIEADDVRCTHGATSGALDDEEIFYFQSRGIPRRVAQQLVTFGFLSEVFERIPSADVAELLSTSLHEKLG